ncbi:MAG: hypothetical protein Q9170_006838 [Blastenia crenularia]
MAGEKQPDRSKGKKRGDSQGHSHASSSQSSIEPEELVASSQAMNIRPLHASTSQNDPGRGSLVSRVTNVLNDFDDLELQGLLVRRYWEIATRPPIDQLRDMAVNILRLTGSRLTPRHAVILLLQAGLNPALAVREYTRSRFPRLERDIGRVVRPALPVEKPKDKSEKPQDSDDRLPIPDDVTVIMAEDPDNPGQMYWRFDSRDYFPDILFQWKKADRKDPTEPVGDMYWRGHLVVDTDRKNIVDFPHIPSTLAKDIEGGCLEAFERLDGRVRHQDLAARQYTPDPKTLPSLKDFKNRDNLLAQRMRRRSGGEHFPEYIEHHLPKELKAQNTTRGFRDLTDCEMQELKSKNLGRFAKRSSTKDPNKRIAYLEMEKQRLKRYTEIEQRKHFKVEESKTVIEQTEEQTSEEEESDAEDSDATIVTADVPRGPDVRNQDPTNKDEEEELHDAMLPTIEHYTQITGNLPVIHNWSRSYLSIHYDIYRHLRRDLGFPVEGDEHTALVGLRRWDGGIRGWRSAELSLEVINEWYAEMRDE